MNGTPSSSPDQTKRGVTAALALAILLASLGTSIVNIALPTLAQVFTASFAEVQWVAVSYLAAMTLSAVFAGRLGDIYGSKGALVAGLGLFAAASLLCGIAPTLPLLVGARALQGAGAAFLMTLSMSLMRELASERGVGRAMGLLGTVSAVGTALGPSLGGMLIPIAGWRVVFLVQVPLTLVALVLTLVSLPSSTDRSRPHAATPKVAVDSNLRPALVINLLVAAVMMTTLVVGPFYLSLGLGLSAAMVGYVMSIGPLIAIVSGAPCGRLVDVWGTRRARTAGLVAMIAGGFVLGLLPTSLGVAGYLLGILLLTPGYQLAQAANNTAALADVAKERRGTVSGLLTLSRNVGLIAGASALAAVFAFTVGGSDFAQASAAAIATGMRVTFLCAAGLMGAAVLIAVSGSLRTGTCRRDA